MTAPTQFPLTWPPMFPRTEQREGGRFKTTLAGALKNVQSSLRAFANDSGKDLADLVISSNVTLGVTRPEDPGVAIWFMWDGMGVCVAVDRYASVESNLQAIHHIIEARRVELRHGTLALVRATFSGFLALPGPGWRQALGFKQDERVTAAAVNKRYRELASENHPDRGGDAGRMAEINNARDAALKELG